MSERTVGIAVRLAKAYLDGFDADPLLNHPDIRQYAEPNFVGKNGKFYLVRCYRCPGTDHESSENWMPAVATGRCAWCGWKPDPEIVAYIYSKMVLEGKAEMNEIRELKVIHPATYRDELRGMTLDEIEREYPTQYAYGKRGVCYDPSDQEDDGDID